MGDTAWEMISRCLLANHGAGNGAPLRYAYEESFRPRRHPKHPEVIRDVGPNLVLWNGVRHMRILELKELIEDTEAYRG